MEVDPSHYVIGAILSQEGRLVAYFSKALSMKHQTLSIYEKEMMAIVDAPFCPGYCVYFHLGPQAHL